jgi:hypothetical protein
MKTENIRPFLCATALLAPGLLSPASSGQGTPLILTGDLESGDFKQFHGREAADHELKIVTSPVRAGKYAARVEVNKQEYNVGGGRFRAEVTHNGAGGANQEKERWFGFSVYLPDDWKTISFPGSDILFQIHERPDKGEDWRSPPLALRVAADKMEWTIRWDSKALSEGNKAEGTATVYSGPLVKGKWVDWVVHVRWSYRQDGLVEVWRDGKKEASHQGPNCYNDQREMYLKIGNYHTGSRGKLWPEGLEQRVSYFDEVRMGGPQATYADVAPPKAAEKRTARTHTVGLR